MIKLSTIQKREKLNDIYAVDEKGPGGANHKYIIAKHGETSWANGNNDTGVLAEIQFQKGARNLNGSMPGVIDTDLLEVVKDRLQAFQAGSFNSKYNAVALGHVEEALMWLNRRVEDRIERNVLGTNNK